MTQEFECYSCKRKFTVRRLGNILKSKRYKEIKCPYCRRINVINNTKEKACHT